MLMSTHTGRLLLILLLDYFLMFVLDQKIDPVVPVISTEYSLRAHRLWCEKTCQRQSYQTPHRHTILGMAMHVKA